MDLLSNETIEKQGEEMKHVSEEHRRANRGLMERLLLLNGGILAFSASLSAVTPGILPLHWAVVISWSSLLVSVVLAVFYLYIENTTWFKRALKSYLGYSTIQLAQFKFQEGRISQADV